MTLAKIPIPREIAEAEQAEQAKDTGSDVTPEQEQAILDRVAARARARQTGGSR